jgi:hypothetical protein
LAKGGSSVVARLLVEDERYEGLASAALLEHEYERLILDRAPAVFPGFTVVPFTPTLVYEGVPKKPDLAIIDPDYRTWWVGEVELGHHSLRDHVLPQVEVFNGATYGRQEAEWLAARNPSLDPVALSAMVRGAQPKVVVVVNVPKPEWVDPLRAAGAVLTVVEVFRSSRNRVILRQNGADLEGLGDVVSECRVDPTMPRLLIVDSPAQLLQAELPLQIEFGDGVSEWTVIEAADRVWLSPVRGGVFPQSSRAFTLVRLAEGRLAFRPNDPQHPRRH